MIDPFDSPSGRTILEHLSDPCVRFVFPTQRSADSWAFAIVQSGKAKAIETDRFISMDRYRGIETEAGREEATQVSRFFWALGIVKEQRDKPFLRDLLPYGLDIPLSRAGSLASMAPRLRLIREAAQRGEVESGSEYLALCTRYEEFLETQGFYEPSMSKEVEDGRYIFLEPLLTKILTPEPAANPPKELIRPRLYCFKNFREELDWVFGSIRNLVEKGIKPNEIAVSVSSLSGDVRAHLLRTAREFRVPVAFIGGEPLIGSAFGKLLYSLSRAMEEGFSARTLRKLAERGPARFRDAESLNNLVSIARRWNIPEMSNDRRRMSGLWARTFSECRIEDSGATALYRSLVRLTSALRSARDFQALKLALFDVRTSLLDETELDDYSQATLQRIFDGLERLRVTHEKLHSPSLPAEPFSILLQELEKTLYSPVERADAVSIQPYALGVLLAAKRHFILDASQNSTLPAARHFNPLPENTSSLAETEARLGCLVLESFGPTAIFCHAEESLSGFTVPHPFFALNEARVIYKGEADEFGQNVRTGIGSEAIASEPIRPGKPARNPEAIAEALHSVTGAFKGDAIRFSPSTLRAFALCPFKWLLSSAPGFYTLPAAPSLLAEGSLMHAMIRSLLEYIRQTDGRVKTEHRNEYVINFDTIFSGCVKDILRKSGVALQPHLEATAVRLKDRLSRLLELEIELEAKGWSIGEFEVSLSLDLGERQVVFEGRADRVMEQGQDGDVAIIDYKRGLIPTKKDLSLREDGSLREFQVASYAEMLESSGKTPSFGLYWSIENCKTTVVFGEGGSKATWADFGPERDKLRSMLDTAAGEIRRGNFMRATPSSEACDGCSFRSVCRAHFSSENL